MRQYEYKLQSMNTEKILYYLKDKTTYVSGEEISRHLGISRASLWKHIQEIRDLGYQIIAVPHLGYQLLSWPDRLFPWEVKYSLNNKIVGKTIYYYESLSSTMDIALDLGLKGAPEGTLVIAEGQHKGRGRMSRPWLSPKYKGIYFSLIIKPKIIPSRVPVFTLISGVAICEALKHSLGLGAQIKWPNDIILNNKKVGGILTELNAEMDIIRVLVVGVGINVNNERKTLPPQATSLRQATGQQVNRLALLQNILRYLEKCYLQFQKPDGLTSLLDRWRHFSATLGRRVKASLQDRQLEGEAVDIDCDGGLLVRRDSGLIEKVMAGDVVHCR